MKDSLFSEHFSISGQGYLTLDGLDLVAAAQEFGTPAYVISEAAVRQQCRAYMQAMKRVFGENLQGLLCQQGSLRAVYLSHYTERRPACRCCVGR